MKKIVFDYQLDGHNLEYLNHLYISAVKDCDNDYIFVLPLEFEKEKKVLNWPSSNNVSFNLYDVKHVFYKSPVRTAWASCKLLRRVIKQFNASEVILIWMIAVLPFLPLFIPRGVKVSGIIYRIYLYSWRRCSWLTKLQNAMKYWILAKSKCVDRVFILNDNSSVCTLNKVWQTNKFTFLADPYVPFSKDSVSDLRTELGVDKDKTIILHLGAMSLNKGTLSILDMIENSKPEDLARFVFVFAGRIYPNIKNEFYNRLSNLQNKAEIIVKDSFLPYEYMGSLVYTCDKVLLPYKRTDMSSGSIAYAAQFEKQVFVPQSGLLGKLVRKYHIGTLVDNFNDVSILNTPTYDRSTYCKSHTVQIFTKTILGI